MIEGKRLKQITERGAGRAGAPRAGAASRHHKIFSVARVEVTDP